MEGDYEFQMLLWWGIYVASLPVLKGAEFLVIVGPIFLTLLLFFVSGIPLLEVLSLSTLTLSESRSRSQCSYFV